MAKTYTKDAAENLDYMIDWATELGADTISTSTWEAESGLTEGTNSNTTTTATVWLSGGTAGTTYTVTNTIVTAGGRTLTETILIAITASSATDEYTTLAKLKSRLGVGETYTAATISFASSTITDTASGLAMFATGDLITVSNSAANDGTYTITTGATAGAIVGSVATFTTEAAGDSITITNVTDVVSDVTLGAIITAASRAIDEYCQRRFYRNSTDETRYYTARFADTLFVTDDIGSVTTLYGDGDGDRTYEDTWAATDFDLMPLNASLDGKPYTWIETTPDGDYVFPVDVNKGVKIVGKFGYGTTAPKQIGEACLLLAQRLFKKPDAIFGVMGGGAMAPVNVAQKMIQDDLELALMLEPFRKVV